MDHAVVMRVKLPVDVGDDDSQVMLNEIVVPLAKSQSGFKSGTWMHDGPDGIGVVIFDSAENAAAAAEVLKPPSGGPQLVSSSVYEVRAKA